MIINNIKIQITNIKQRQTRRTTMKIGFLGLGNMGSAMIGGIIKNGVVDAKDVLGADPIAECAKNASEKFGITTVDSNAEVVKNADYLVLAVKPQMYQTVIDGIKNDLRDDTVVISIAPGKTIDWVSGLFGKSSDEMKLVRCMPNTPALVGEGCTGVCFAKSVSDTEKETVLTILNSFGKASEVPEHLMDTVVGVSGSSPAYVFMFIEAMADAAVLDGMPRKQAYEFAAQAVLGSAKMVLETGMHPGELKDMVCSPAGTTIEAVRVLEERGFRSSIIEAQKACVDKSRSL